MKRNGFTLVEIMIVIGVIGILIAIATLNFGPMTKNAAISAQTKMLYTELLGVRVQAMYGKQPRLIELSSKNIIIYRTDSNTSPQPLVKNLSYPIVWGGASSILFDIQGLANVPGTGNKCICIDEENSGSYDSIVIFKTRIQMGKRIDSAGGCNSGNISVE